MFIKCYISFTNFLLLLLEIHLHIKNSNYFISEKKFGFQQTTFFERFEATIQRAGARLGHGRSEWLKLSRYKNCLLSVTVHLFATNARKGRNDQERCTSDTFYRTQEIPAERKMYAFVLLVALASVGKFWINLNIVQLYFGLMNYEYIREICVKILSLIS